ncbi:type II toxin-antitoxin system SpoIISB family antitoxin [Jeotgalibacillus soli]|uniref:Uncharacterized protein n=1 Tax=Jeotgalibacillus soli TaxID=889306 RepID=A0A0C2VMX7_9BACL|nr:type II toxin-antitoxin system SpoIISB family antitoxin [Jeotgalibacillus soli]KIL45358.1 hypothetical protein KP78_29020 [Jeotgalibacillus soli]
MDWDQIEEVKNKINQSPLKDSEHAMKARLQLPHMGISPHTERIMKENERLLKAFEKKQKRGRFLGLFS